MKNKSAVVLGRMAKGKKKTMTPAALDARRAQMAKINTARLKRIGSELKETK